MNPVTQPSIFIPVALISGGFILSSPSLASEASYAKTQATASITIMAPLVASQHRLLRFGEFECEKAEYADKRRKVRSIKQRQGHILHRDDHLYRHYRSNTSCTLTLAPRGRLSYTGNIDDLDGAFKPAVFSIKGAANQSYRIILPGELVSGELTVTDFVAFSKTKNHITTQGQLNHNGSDKVYVGVTLTIPAGYKLESPLRLDIPLMISY